MYHVSRDPGSPQYSYSSGYRENRRSSVPSYALIPHNSNPTHHSVQYSTTRYSSEPPARYRSEPRYVRYHSDPRLYGDSRDHIDYQEQRYVVPYSSSTSTRSNTHTQYRTSHSRSGRGREVYAPGRYSQYNNGQSRAYRYRSREVVEKPIPVCACVIM